MPESKKKTLIDKLLENGSLSEMQDPVNIIGREDEIEFLKETLAKRRMRNVILIGNAGVGKTSIVEKVADLAKEKFHFLKFDIVSVVSNTRYRGEFEEKMNAVIKAVTENNKYACNRKIVLFIDEIHMIYRAGISDDSQIDASNILKQHLSAGDIMIFGATTPKEYDSTIGKDGSLMRRMTPLFIKEPSMENVLKIENDFCKEDNISDEIIKYVYERSKTLTGYFNPDISIEICDRCIAKRKCTKKEINKQMVDEIISFMKESSDGNK